MMGGLTDDQWRSLRETVGDGASFSRTQVQFARLYDAARADTKPMFDLWWLPISSTPTLGFPAEVGKIINQHLFRTPTADLLVRELQDFPDYPGWRRSILQGFHVYRPQTDYAAMWDQRCPDVH